jgi:hypothetical protein
MVIAEKVCLVLTPYNFIELVYNIWKLWMRIIDEKLQLVAIYIIIVRPVC